MSSTGRALLRGGSFRLISLATSLGLQMAMLPYVLKHLGDHLYGLWAVIGAATGYYGLLDLGVSSAVTWFVAKERGRNDLVSAANYVAASKRVFFWSAVAVCVLSVAIAVVGSGFIASPEDRVLFFKTTLIAGLGIGLSFPSAVYSGLLVADLRHDVIAAMGFGSTILRAGLVFFALAAGGQVVALATINASISVAFALATIIAAKRLCQPLPAVKTPPAGTLRALFGYAGYTLVSQIADFIRTKVHPITISAFLRLADVTPYSIQDRLQGIVVDACSACLSMLTPVFSRQEGQGDRGAILRTYLLAYKISCYVGSFILGILLIVAPHFIQVWLGPGHDVIVQLLYLRAAGSLCGIIQMPSVNLLFGSNENRSYAIINSIHAAVTLGSTVMLIQRWGLPGVVIGVSATTMIMKTFVQAAVAGRVVGISFRDMHLKHTLPNLARVIPFLLATGFLAHLWLNPSWFRLTTFLAVVGPTFAAYIFYLGFSRPERDLFLRSARLKK